ncbi:LacI family DNA-binding transcriptional regulator [Clostridium sp. SM-530-WT-3G]|uniref:LacI family DNA-binding transcriptional regulator n=1 Tax=Clostridium sp. SM-530-WT-3G TaxID=2725303 RepID=UPI00145D2B68|nr:LacI family DNA-binding transcriptional regulator [Clostridium sp. SM-530-WT-3G]NME83168.1 LacI family transcriptional regulator [Clostridium sp. SM-530-WT-3G]
MATIKDVAREAGVAVGTVSKVINNIAVKPQTKALVEAAIEKLKYEPNTYARGFKLNKTNTVAVIVPTIWHPFFSELVYNIEKSLRKVGMKMILCNSEENKESEIEYISMAKQNKMDGIIAITYSNIDEYVSDNIPFISIDRYFSKDITYISSDNFEGGRLAAEKLVEAGCRKLAYIGRGSKIDNDTRNRKEGFIKYCTENNIDYDICEVLGASSEYELLIDKFIEKNFKNNISIDGVFAITDRYAFDFINKLKKVNVRVPDDVQVIGFDGSRSSARDELTLSTIRQPIEQIAQVAVSSLINIIEKKKVDKNIILPVTFIKGQTTK